MPERQRFSQLQRAGQRAEILAGEVGEGAARRLVKDQRLQPRVAKPGQKRFIPRLVTLRQHAKTYVVRGADGGMQIEVPARCPRVGKKRGNGSLQPPGARRFITHRELCPAATKHAVEVACEIALVLRQRGRIPQHHQQTTAQRERPAEQRAQHNIDNLHGCRFVPVNTGRKQQRKVILPCRRQLKHARPQPPPVERGAFPSCSSGVSAARVSASKFSIPSP